MSCILFFCHFHTFITVEDNTGKEKNNNNSKSDPTHLWPSSYCRENYCLRKKRHQVQSLNHKYNQLQFSIYPIYGRIIITLIHTLLKNRRVLNVSRWKCGKMVTSVCGELAMVSRTTVHPGEKAKFVHWGVSKRLSGKWGNSRNVQISCHEWLFFFFFSSASKLFWPCSESCRLMLEWEKKVESWGGSLSMFSTEGGELDDAWRDGRVAAEGTEAGGGEGFQPDASVTGWLYHGSSLLAPC